jgi:hypothetical protein
MGLRGGKQTKKGEEKIKTLVEAWEHFIEGGYPDPIKNDPSMQVIFEMGFRYGFNSGKTELTREILKILTEDIQANKNQPKSRTG